MAKLIYKKIETCKECPEYFGSKASESHCKFTNVKIITDEIPGWCHLINYEEKTEVNETGRIWVKIK